MPLTNLKGIFDRATPGISTQQTRVDKMNMELFVYVNFDTMDGGQIIL